MMNQVRLECWQRWRRKMAELSVVRHVVMDSRGFALLEIMIALMVAGLLIGPGVKMWRLHRQQTAYRTTVAHQKTVFQALADYWTLHGCLPWPSRLGGESQGISERPSSDSFYRGIIPYRTLGLSHTIARDGWGQWMVYWVDAVMTTPGMLYQDTWCRTCFARPSVLDVIDEGTSVQAGLTQSPQNHRPMAGGAGVNARPRVDGVAVILLADPDSTLFPQASSLERTSPSTALKDQGPVISIRPESSATLVRRVVQWKTRSHILALIGVRCVDSFFASSPPTIDRSSTSNPNLPLPAPSSAQSSVQSAAQSSIQPSSATSGKIVMRPMPSSP